MTGLGLKLGNFIVYLSGGNLFPLLLAAMALSIILGLGLPTAPAYIITSSVVGPALVSAGVPMLTAHLFVFYFSLLAMVTPPVALVSFTAASIAKANTTETCWEGFKLTFAAFIVPYMFVYSPVLLMEGTVPMIVWATITAVIGIVFFACSIQGFFFGELSIIQRGLLFIASLMTIYSGLITDLIGALIFGIVIFGFSRQREKVLRYVRR